ncbi:hypothetical protein [Methylophaga nitratireducenticrescens]|uniref:hypothetical protein n=1 Tax=Methylophaga nitratireducenticrescens TaxID=754476 RepID=UPI00146E577F|nr:hypothetical protein [Methylophaga nitratireducenticrescens]
MALTMDIDSLKVGYTDQQLESLSKLGSRFEAGIAPWAAWESENSSFGKTLRKWALYPSFLPIFLSSDHGVHWESRCWPNELSSPYTFVSWNQKKSEKMRMVHQKRSYYIPHPWVHYRKKYYPTLPENRKGTLVFFAHSNNTTSPKYSNLDGYIQDLKELPEKYQPVVICLSFHDIQKGLHKTLRKYELPLVTVGTTNSQKFVDRFYSLISQFNFCTSPNIGSHTFYVIEAGIPFFLFGPYPEYHIKGSNAVNDGKQRLSDYGDDEDIENFSELKALLSTKTDSVTEQQRKAVFRYLGMDSEISRHKASWILWRELFFNTGKIPSLYITKVIRLVKKISNHLA